MVNGINIPGYKLKAITQSVINRLLSLSISFCNLVECSMCQCCYTEVCYCSGFEFSVCAYVHEQAGSAEEER